MRPQTVAIHNWNNYLFLLKHLTALQTPYFVNSGGIYNRGGISEIHPANCQLTAADVAAIAMIRNNAVWIHGLIKQCLRSWTAARTNFAISTLVFAKWQSRPPRENMSTTSRCDLYRNACKTTRSGAMNTDGIMIPRSKLRKYCHGQLRQLSRMSIRGFSCTIA